MSLLYATLVVISLVLLASTDASQDGESWNDFPSQDLQNMDEEFGGSSNYGRAERLILVGKQFLLADEPLRAEEKFLGELFHLCHGKGH
jgi:hypothetical protein